MPTAARARLIRNAYEADPLECPECKGAMRLIALIDDPAVVRRILEHVIELASFLLRRIARRASNGPTCSLHAGAFAHPGHHKARRYIARRLLKEGIDMLARVLKDSPRPRGGDGLVELVARLPDREEPLDYPDLESDGAMLDGASSLRPQPHCADELAPLFDLGPDEGAELVG